MSVYEYSFALDGASRFPLLIPSWTAPPLLPPQPLLVYFSNSTGLSDRSLSLLPRDVRAVASQ